MKEGISLWRKKIDDQECCGLQFMTSSGYGIFWSKNDSEQICIGLITEAKNYRYLPISISDIPVLRSLLKLLVTRQNTKEAKALFASLVESGKVFSFSERRPIGLMKGWEVVIGLPDDPDDTTLRVYRMDLGEEGNMLFTHMMGYVPADILFALTLNHKELVCVSFDIKDLTSIEEVFQSI
jgi:hypothetical protein